MGRIVLAAKITHVPTMLMSEQPGRVHGTRRQAIEGHIEIASRAKSLGADTIVICDTHWIVNAGYHLNANERFTGTFTSSEFPHFIQNLAYDYQGNPALGDSIAEKARAKGVHTLSHRIDSLDLEYGTLVPMYFMSRVGAFKVISIAAWCVTHAYETSRKLGQAIKEAVEASDNKVLLLASGSFSHKLWANDDYEANNGTFTISSEFNRQMDLRVLELWQKGEIDTFLRMLVDYATHCSGEGLMHDTAMMFGALGWDQYAGKGEIKLESIFQALALGKPMLFFRFNLIRKNNILYIV